MKLAALIILSTIFIAPQVTAAASKASKAPALCHAKASQTWRAGNKNLLIEAFAEGPTCTKAVVTLVIRDASGAPIWYEASSVDGNMILSENPKANSEAMAPILKNWILIDNRQKPSDSLPEWKLNAESPEAMEFPFYPNEHINQEQYTKIRNAKLPMFCFVSGMESETCLVLEKDGAITNVGLQSFPG